MDVYKNLPLAARIAIPSLVALVLAFLLYSMALKPAAKINVIKTTDVELFETAQKVLKSQSIDFEESREGTKFMLWVADGEETDAARVLAKSGIKDRTGLAPKKTCPAAPGFTATKAANERADNCSDALRVQSMLLSAGATAANVEVSQQSSDSFLGPEKTKNVVVQAFLPTRMRQDWNAEEAAQAFAAAVGTSVDRVVITDDRIQSLYDPKKGAEGTNGSSTTSAASSGLGCGDIESATDVATKQSAVRNCMEDKIGSKLSQIVGGSDRFVLVVEPTIDAVARQTTATQNTKGATESSSKQSSDGSKTETEDNSPSSKTSTSVDPAGDITKMSITVILDKKTVSEELMVAVKTALTPYVITSRGDPVPSVRRAPLGTLAGDEDATERIEKIREESVSKETEAPLGTITERAVVPMWAKALIAVLIVGIITTIVILLRRSSSLAAERTRLEESFRTEQRLFEDFAQQRPDELAADLNALFGAPPARDPQFH
ncbi:MAG: hypothetical protein JWM86_2467 [Thermoleophilia bacterium]|nr:hypothetical protein [Thermoleophilia bacterium]